MTDLMKAAIAAMLEPKAVHISNINLHTDIGQEEAKNYGDKSFKYLAVDETGGYEQEREAFLYRERPIPKDGYWATDEDYIRVALVGNIEKYSTAVVYRVDYQEEEE